jgi:transcriptional regulator with XRE-family HTH domain
MNEINNVIQKIIDTRKSKYLSQHDISTITGISQPIIARMESGKNIPRLDTLLKVVDALSLKLDIKERNEKEMMQEFKEDYFELASWFDMEENTNDLNYEDMVKTVLFLAYQHKNPDSCMGEDTSTYKEEGRLLQAFIKKYGLKN